MSLISLGCSKNTVDSELILGRFAESGWLIAEDPAEADVCLVNTCGFIQDARDETAAVLREVRAAGGERPRKVAVLGCLVQRATDQPEFRASLEGADAGFLFDQYCDLPALCWALLHEGDPAREEARKPEPYARFLHGPRLRFGLAHSACLKLAEGCSNRCAFCSIPLIRGPQASRPLHDIILEAKDLVASGAVELNLIAQDTAAYGRDLEDGLDLSALLRVLRDQIRDPVWFRLMYACPHHLTREMLEVMASDSRFCPYLDVPLQHISDRVLRAMGRPLDRAQTEAKLDEIVAALPGVALRTTFITGHPGEEETDFQELLEFVRQGRFMHAGVFAYSEEPGTRSAAMSPQVDPEVGQERCRQVMEAQQSVSAATCTKQVGQTVEVLIDRTDAEGSVGRTRQQAPEVDGTVWIPSHHLSAGTWHTVRIRGADAYDLIAEPL